MWGMGADRYDLKELSRLADVTPRTVHFYVQQGLLPPASTTGPGARYDDEHLLRLRAIRLLKGRHLPLAEIRKTLTGLGTGEMERLLQESSSPRPASALDYVRGVLAEALSYTPRERPRSDVGRPGTERSQWDRIVLAEDIELHVRRPLSRDMNRRVDRVVAAARRILEEN